jgi:hypothetical protein
MRRTYLIAAFLAGAAIALAGGVAYATIPGPGNVYSACMLKGVGQIRLIDPSLPSTNLMSHCTNNETAVSWNEAGQPGPAGPQGVKGDPGVPGTNGTNGTDGVSVKTAAEPAGSNCAGGGVQLSAVNGISYVCNGKDGTNGTNGADGKDGVNVTSALELPGSNCPRGGSRFTTVNGTTYACNGASGIGLPQVYTKMEGADVTFGATTPGDVVIVARSVPAGSYLVNGDLAVYNTGPAFNEAQCNIEGASSFSSIVRIPNDSFDWPVHVSGVIQLPVSGEIKLVCDTDSAVNTLTTNTAMLTAIEVTLAP